VGGEQEERVGLGWGPTRGKKVVRDRENTCAGGYKREKNRYKKRGHSARSLKEAGEGGKKKGNCGSLWGTALSTE